MSQAYDVMLAIHISVVSVCILLVLPILKMPHIFHIIHARTRKMDRPERYLDIDDEKTTRIIQLINKMTSFRWFVIHNEKKYRMIEQGY